MINEILPLIGAFFSSGVPAYFLYPLFALAFIACIPGFFRKMVRN